jgi:asparagine synthase (glutamine-hydrolysing)
MLNTLAHRGPDDCGTFEATANCGRVWLGHRRLAIVDLSPGGHQPMTSASGALTVVFNGEIYNCAPLRDELSRGGYGFRSRSDTEVLLAAWEVWGESALDRLRGMFAFAMWDARVGTTWLARDRLGEKPLYYHATPERLVFSSELRSLLASGFVPRVLDPDGVESYLAFGWVTQPYTAIRDVRMLGAGEVLRYAGGEVAVREYWSQADASAESRAQLRPQAVAAVREALDDAIRLCMVADVPVALLLSGGVDSTALLARLTALGYDGVETFSVGFDGIDARHSEADWARVAAKHFGARHHEVMITGAGARQLIPNALAAVDLPSIDGFNHYLVFQAIARAGFKVALTGQGADELFYGYGRHQLFTPNRLVAHMRAPRAVRLIATRALAALGLHGQRLRKSITLFDAGYPTALAYAVRHIVFSGEEIARLLGRPVAGPVRFVTEPVDRDPIAQLYDMESRHYLRNQLLRDGDQMSMALSLELRAPFVDYRLVETVAPIPTAFKILPGRQKSLLVDAVDDPLVAAAAGRPKAGFPFPIARWLEQELDVQSLGMEAIGFDGTATRQIAERGRRGLDWQRYWTLLVLAAWMRANAMSF